MRQIGAELLVIKPGHATQVQVMAENEQQMCDLQRIVQGMEDGLDQALDLMGQWIGEKSGGHVTIYSDFGAATLAEASAALLFEMKADGSLSHATLLTEMKRRGIISPDVDIKAEIAAALAELAAREPQRKENVNI
jgi:dTDP-glucose pyrophosphorylase